jgi:hypothetical protein
MPTPTTYPSGKQFVNLAKETTQGTPVETGQKTYPFKEFKPKDDPVWLTDEGMRGSMVKNYGQIQGPQKSTFTGAGAVFLDLLPHLLLNLMGAVTTTGPASSIYTHVASLLNTGTAQPPSHTFTDFQGLTATSGARSYAGGSLSELTLKGNPESTLLEMAIKGSGFWSNAFPTAPPSLDLPTESPIAAWHVELAFGGVLPGSKNLTVREWEVTTTREISVQHTSQNSQAPYIIQRGAIETEGKCFVAKPSDETFLNYMRSNTQPQFQLAVSNGLAGANARTLTIDINAMAFTAVEVNRGDAAVGYDCTWVGVANTTNAGASGGYSPIKYTVTNAIASY